MFRSFVARAATAAAVSVASVAASSSSAQAQDRLLFLGQVNVTAQNAGTQLFLDFINSANSPFVGFGSTGAFAGLTTFTPGTIQDVAVSTTGLVGGPVANFVRFGAYTFTLTSTPIAPPATFNFGPISLDNTANGSVATFSVNGTVTGGAFGTANRTFTGSFTAPFTGENAATVAASLANGSRLVNFSADFLVAPLAVVPEPSTYALMASGVAMLGLLAYRRRSQA